MRLWHVVVRLGGIDNRLGEDPELEQQQRNNQ
jgi:hypothetical protein